MKQASIDVLGQVDATVRTGFTKPFEHFSAPAHIIQEKCLKFELRFRHVINLRNKGKCVERASYKFMLPQTLSIFLLFSFTTHPRGSGTTYLKFIVHCEEIIAASSADLRPPTLGPQPPSTFAQILDIFTKLKSYIH